MAEEACVCETASDDKKKRDADVMAALKSTFRPEFLNRLDEIIIFNKLSDSDIEKIAEIMLTDVKRRMDALNVEVTFTDEIIKLVAKEGFDPVYGARPLRRAITHMIEDSFSGEMLEGRIKGGDRITATVKDGKVFYEKMQDAEK